MANADETKTTTNNNGSTESTEVEKKSEIVLTKELEERIIRQVEYYFGDINLPRDKFLLEQIALDDGWVPISVLLSFKRLQSICDDADIIIKALTKATNNLLLVNEADHKVKRNPDVPIPEYNEERRKELLLRTAYVKGFPKNEELEVLEKFMSTFGPVDSIIMRSYQDKAIKQTVFKGSIFAIFKNVESCKKLIEQEEVKYNDTPLIVKWQADYLEEKKKEREEKNNEKRNRNKNREDISESKKPQFPKGAILHMTGFAEQTIREQIKEEVNKIVNSDIAYVTFDKGDKEGYLRFAEENAAVEFVKKLTDSKFKVNEAEITVRALEGEEEDKFLVDLCDTMLKMRNRNMGGRGKKRRGGRDHGPRAKYDRRD